MKTSTIVIATVFCLLSGGVLYVSLFQSNDSSDPLSQSKSENTAKTNVGFTKRATVNRELPKRNIDERKQLLSSRSDSQGVWRFSERKGQVSRAFGAKVQLDRIDESLLADKAREIMPLFNLHPSDLADRAYPIGGQKQSEGIQIYSVAQMYQGYPVYDSRLRLSVDHSTQSIVGLNGNELKMLHSELPETIQKRKQLERSLRQSQGPVHVFDSVGPFVWPDQEGRARLVFEAKSGDVGVYSPHTETLLVDAETGQILHRRLIAVSEEF